jgi:hypothetical protein
MSDRHATDAAPDTPAPEQPEASEETQPHLYRHAGITESDGQIPFWLILVVVGLLIWSVYYAIRFWSPG